jgi:hypothetical protein
MIRVELSIVGCLLGAYALFLIAMFGVMWARASGRRRRGVGTRTHTPQIRDALADYLSGSNDQTRIREFARSNRAEFVDTLLEFHGTVGGSARDRLCDLALELSLVYDWCRDAGSKDQLVRRKAYTRLSFVCAYEPCRRVAGDLLLQALKDADPEVRLPAARALVQSGTIAELGQVFRLAVSQSLLIRILLSEDLRRHATELCAQAIPQVLAGDNSTQTAAALQILVAWERALPLSDLHKLLESNNREVRLEALRLAKLVPLTPQNRSALLRFLREGDEEENTLAALTAARLRLQENWPASRLRRWRKCRPRVGKRCNKSPAAPTARRSSPRQPWIAGGERRAPDGSPGFHRRAGDLGPLDGHGNRRICQPGEGLFRVAAHRARGPAKLYRDAPQISHGAASLHHCGSSRCLCRVGVVRAPAVGASLRPQRSSHRAGWAFGKRVGRLEHRIPAVPFRARSR